MNTQSAAVKSGMHISVVKLELLAALLGLIGTILVILQAHLWVPKAHANPAVLVLLAFVPLIAAVFIALTPRRLELEQQHTYLARTATVWVNLGLPLLLTTAVMLLAGFSGNFDHFSGFALVLGVNAGRNLRNWIRCLVLDYTDVRK